MRTSEISTSGNDISHHCILLLLPWPLLVSTYPIDLPGIPLIICFAWKLIKYNILSGYGEIHAVNIREMIFVMAYVSLDMILGAYLLGNMAALIVRGSKTERFRDKMADLIKYMNRNKLGKNISKEIKNHVRLQYESSYPEAEILQHIPVSIRAKVINNTLYNIIDRNYLRAGTV